MSLSAAKAAARKAAFACRKAAFDAGDRDAGAARLAEALAPEAGKVLAGYMAMRTEIDPLPAMAVHPGPVCVPVIQGTGLALRFRQWSLDVALIEGEFGALIPASGEWLVPEVLIVPLVAFDRRGYRLGYGGGFYDRTLEHLRAEGPVLAIGFAWAAQEDAAIPIDPTDQRLDLIVTDRETIRPG